MRYADIVAASSIVTEQIGLPERLAIGAYWHGTNNVNGQRIMASGLKGGGEVVRPVGGKSINSTVEGTYLARRMTYALAFAYKYSKQKYGWVFHVDAKALTQVELDEDDIGKALKAAIRYGERPDAASRVEPYRQQFEPEANLVRLNVAIRNELLSLAESHLDPDLLNNLRGHSFNHQWFSDAGTALRQHLSTATTLAFIEAGCHIVSLDGVKPSMAWRFDRKLGTDIHNLSLRTTPIRALDELAERMR